MRFQSVLAALFSVGLISVAFGSDSPQSSVAPARLIVSPKTSFGPVKPVHGVNRGPIVNQGESRQFDLSPHFTRMHIPSVRLHDCPFVVKDAVDLHCLFPDPKADPDDPKSYNFGPTDDYLKAIQATGAEIFFRLGESIEHQPVKKYIRPEIWDNAVLARVCVNIVRHYNHGWANGLSLGIKHWEIWNEPDLDYKKPAEERRMWTGTAEQFFDLYKAVAVALKKFDPALKIGGASFEHPWVLYDQTNPYYDFFRKCVAQGVPLDFFSWHDYLADWHNITTYAHNVRKALDGLGLTRTESYLTEWGYLAAVEDNINVFNARRNNRAELYPKALAKQRGPARTPVIFGVLARIQDLPVQQAHHYTGDLGATWGMFESDGQPNNIVVALDAFASFLGMDRVQARLEAKDAIALVAKTGTTFRIGLATIEGFSGGVELHFDGDDLRHYRVKSARRHAGGQWDDITCTTGQDPSDLVIPAQGPALTLIELEPTN